jgi:hypothetical protein
MNCRNGTCPNKDNCKLFDKDADKIYLWIYQDGKPYCINFQSKNVSSSPKFPINESETLHNLKISLV